MLARRPEDLTLLDVVHVADGSRRITHITEVMGMEGDTIITQDLFVYEMDGGEDENGKLRGKHKSTGIARPGWALAAGAKARAPSARARQRILKDMETPGSGWGNGCRSGC